MENIKTVSKIKSLLESNKNGITINLNGNIDRKKIGYYVAVTDNKINSLSNSYISKLVNKALLLQKKNGIKIFIGGWFSKITNKWYIDITLYIRNKNKALEIAKNKKQLAIFGIKKLQSIYL